MAVQLVQHQLAEAPAPNQQLQQLAHAFHEQGQVHAQQMRAKNQALNAAREELVQIAARLRQATERGDLAFEQIGRLEQDLQAARVQKDEQIQLRQLAEAGLQNKAEEVQVLHQLIQNKDEVAGEFQQEIERLEAREAALTEQIANLRLELENEQRLRRGLERQIEVRLARIKRQERDRADQRIDDERRYDLYICEFRDIRNEYATETLKITAASVSIYWGSVATTGAVGALVIGPAGFIARFCTPSERQLALMKRVAQIKGPFIIIHNRLRKPPLHADFFNVEKFLKI